MSVDFSTLPFSPLLVVVGLGYAVFSSEVSGPLMIDRELKKSGWHASCQSDLEADIRTWRGPEPLSMPRLDCESTFGTIYGDQGKAFCDNVGNFKIPIPGLDALRDQQDHARAMEQRRMERAASNAPTACACAQDVFVSSERVSVALYAASGRLITTPALANRDAGLSRALNSPLCRGEGQP